MLKYYKYNTFFFYNINYLFKLSKNNLIYFDQNKLSYIKKFKNTFRYILYINYYILQLNLSLYFFKKLLKNNFVINFSILNLSSFKSLKNFLID